MSKSFFITSVDCPAGKREAVLAALKFSAKKSCKAAYFKPIVQNADEPGFKAAIAAAGLGGDVSSYYGLTLSEAFELLNQGRDGALMDAVLPKFSLLAAQYDAVVIEGLDIEGPAAGALAALDAALAANLGSPVILLSGGEIEASALAVRSYQSRQADVFALAMVSANPGRVATDKELPPLAGVKVWGLASPADVAAHLETACGPVCGYTPKAMTPKRFEFELIEKAKADKQHIVLPEGNDERILRAADDILKKDFAEITILGDPDAINKQAKTLGLTALSAKARLIDHKTSPMLPELTGAFYELRKAKGITEEKAAAQMLDRNFFATMLVKLKKADGMVSGADGTTADTIRPALSIIKTKPGCSI
ncbi:MAG: AAA family ATPase, partial [Candidatus Adiutrix sp.]|nr:AAA family ATPase [Candidatus Adiutrix sp.]